MACTELVLWDGMRQAITRTIDMFFRRALYKLSVKFGKSPLLARALRQVTKLRDSATTFSDAELSASLVEETDGFTTVSTGHKQPSNRQRSRSRSPHARRGPLTTELFTKPTSSLAYLLRNSYHPRRVFDALPYGEFVRTRRNCSTIESYDSHSYRLLQAFVERGYKPDQLEKARSKARQLSRQDILNKYAQPVPTQVTEPLPSDQFYLTVKFFQSSHLVRDLVKHNWTLLGNSETTTNLYESKLVVGYKRNPRLRDMLVKSSIPIVKNYGKSGKSSNSCQDANCKYCPYIDVSGNIFSTTTKKRHNAKFNVCCNSSNLIYCLTCGTCEKQYVGMTKRKLKQRLYEHLRNIRQGKLNDPIGRHFSKVPHNSDPSKVKVHVLSFITHPPDSRTALNMRLRFELDWIHRLRTTLPRGLNAMH